MQRNWIGRSEGAARRLPRRRERARSCPSSRRGRTRSSGRRSSCSHPSTRSSRSSSRARSTRPRCSTYVRHTAARSTVERETKEKDGVFTGRYAVNPVNGESIPIWVADYVLMDYGTGAIMAVPAHDERDYAFARALRASRSARSSRRPTARTRRGRAPTSRTPTTRCSSTRASSTGCPRPEGEARDRRVARRARASARRRSATACATGCFSRQRYWGCPIPIIHCDACGDRPRAGRPAAGRCCRTSRTTSRRAARRSPRPRTGSTTTCPTCGGAALRETDTMDTFVDSSWYFLRYTDPRNDDGAVRPRRSSTTGCPSTSTSAAIEHAIAAPALRAVLHEGAERPRPASGSASRSRASSTRG